MSNSPLVKYTKLSPNNSGARKHAIDRISIHCVVGQCSIETLGALFASTAKQASSNYGIGPDGRVGMYVEEKNRSWCTSSSENDNRAITIETASDTTHPYAVKPKAFAALLDLCEDICRRNGKKKLLWFGDKARTLDYTPAPDEMVLTVHRWFANKSCPGEYLYNRHGEIAQEVTKRLGSTAPAPTGTEINVGDIVEFTGNCHYSSANGNTSFPCKPGQARVTRTATGKHPYHLIHTGPGCTVYGWVDEKDIRT